MVGDCRERLKREFGLLAHLELIGMYKLFVCFNHHCRNAVSQCVGSSEAKA